VRTRTGLQPLPGVQSSRAQLQNSRWMTNEREISDG
jgi:hypothetical protein